MNVTVAVTFNIPDYVWDETPALAAARWVSDALIEAELTGIVAIEAVQA